MKKNYFLMAVLAMAFAMQSCQKDQSSLAPSSGTPTNDNSGGISGTIDPGVATVNGNIYTIGDAANFSVLGLPGTRVDLSNTTINGGKVGVGSGGSLNFAAPTTINGTMVVSSGVAYKQTGTLNGSLVLNADLSSAAADAIQGSIDLAGLTANASFNTINSSQTFQGNGGVFVISANNINLSSGDNIVLNGTASDYFVINVTGTFTMDGDAQISVTGSVPSSHVIVNIIGTGSTGTTKVGNRIFGTVLATQRSLTFHGVTGQVICGGAKVTLMSAAILNFVPGTTFPLPGE